MIVGQIKNFNYFNKSFGRVEIVITFAAPKEGKHLLRDRDLREGAVRKHIRYGSAFTEKQVLIFYGKFFDILKQKK